MKTEEIGRVWCPTQILYSYYQIPYRYPFSFKSHNLAPAARLTTIKNYVIIYIMKSMPLRAPASYLCLLGKLFIAAQVFAAPIYITPVPFHDSVSIVKYLLFYFTIIL